MADLKLKITPRRIGSVVGAVIGLLMLASVLGQIARYTILNKQVRWYVAVFDVNREQNLPTYWQGMLILVAAVLFGIIAWLKWTQRDRFRIAWTGLAVITLMLSVDEMCSLHEQLGLLMENRGYQMTGALKYAWVVPGLVIALMLGLMFLRFLLHLPAAVRNRLILCAAIYASGTIGMEMIGGWYADRYGDNNLTCQLLANFEELLEMSGMALLVVTLVGYLSDQVSQLTILIAPSREAIVAEVPACPPELNGPTAISPPSA